MDKLKTKHCIHVYQVSRMIKLDVSVEHSFEIWEDRGDFKARNKAKKILLDLSKKGKLKWEKPDCKTLVIDLETLKKL